MKKYVTSLIKHPLFSGSFIMVAGSMGVNVINYIYHLIMGRVLGPVDYGVLLSLYSLLYLASIIPISTSVAIVKFISSAKNKKEVIGIYNGINNFIFKVALVSAAVVLLASPGVAGFLKIDLSLVVLVAPVLFATLVTLVNQASAQGLLKFMGNVGPNLVSAIFKFVLGFLFVFLGWRVLGAMLGVVLGAILSYFYSRFLIKKWIKRGSLTKFKIAPFLKFSLPTLLQALAFTSFFSTDVLLVKHFLPAYEAGLYAAISTLGKIIYFAAAPISGVMFPVVAGRHARGEKYRKVFALSLIATVIISGGVVAVYWLLPKIVIGVLFGSGYLVAQKELVWMGLFVSLLSISYFLMNYFLSLGRTKLVILPLVIVPTQILGIVLFHNSLLEVIQVSLICMVLLFVGLSGYLLYNRAYEEGGK